MSNIKVGTLVFKDTMHLSVPWKFHWWCQYSDPHWSTLPWVGAHTFVSSTALTVNRQSYDFDQPICPADLLRTDTNQLNMNTGTEHGGSLGSCYMFLSVN